MLYKVRLYPWAEMTWWSRFELRQDINILIWLALERWENLSLRWCHHRKQKDRLLGYGGMLSVS